MRCRHDQRRDLTEATLAGDARGSVVFRKQPRSSRLSNAHDKLRDGLARGVRKHDA